MEDISIAMMMNPMADGMPMVPLDQGLGVLGLGIVKGSRVANKISGYTRHGLNQAIGRNGRGVNLKAMLEAVKNPKKVINQVNGTIKYVGQKATVILNKAGEIVTTWGKARR